MRNASGHQCKVKMSGSEKKVNENTYDISSIKKFLEVSRCGRAKQRQRNVQKSVLHVQSCFFANQTYCCFFTVLVAFAAQHYTILCYWAASFQGCPVINSVFGRLCGKTVPQGREDTRVWYRETMFSQVVSYDFPCTDLSTNTFVPCLRPPETQKALRT